MPELLAYSFDECPGVRAVTTLRLNGDYGMGGVGWDSGNRTGDDWLAVQRRRESLARALGCEILWLEQVHGRDVLAAESPGTDGKPPRADGMVVSGRGLACAVQTADCLPVLMAVSGGPVAAVHAGWKGLAAGVLESALRAMRTEPARIHVQIGPHIGRTSYQVGLELRDRLVQESEDLGAFVPDDAEGKLLCDLGLLAQLRLRRGGVGSVKLCALDTCRHSRLLHSARRDGERSGRMASVIWRS